jgi:hypothetical protein
MGALLFLVALPTVGCAANTPAASHAPPPPAAAAPPVEKVPPELRADIERAERLGRQIYLYDKASAIGTDALLEKMKSLDGLHLGGYLPLLEEGRGARPAFVVLFFTDAPEPQIAYRIRVPMEAGAKPTVEKLDPPIAPSAGERAFMRARQTAIAALPKVVQPINPLVFPGEAMEEDGILVYLLAGTTRPQIAVLGRHHRVFVSPDGRTVRRFEPLSKSILEIPLLPRDAPDQTAGVVVTHLLTNAPIETHVFASLLYRTPIFVVTARGQWQVADGRITFLGALPRE